MIKLLNLQPQELIWAEAITKNERQATQRERDLPSLEVQSKQIKQPKT